MFRGRQRPQTPAAILFLSAALAAGAWLLPAEAEACTVWTTSTGAELHFPPGATVTYYIHVDGSSDLDPTAAYEAVQRAFETWGEVVCGADVPQVAFEFVELIDTDPQNFDPALFRDEKNMVAFIDEGWSGDPAVLARTRLLWNEDTGEIMEFGIALNDQYTDWSATEGGEAGKYDIQSVLMRQIGLIMGLGSSEFEESVMHPVLRENNTDKRTLANDDVLAVCDLYAPGRADWIMAPEDASCTRDLHPGAQPANNTGNNNTNNSDNNGNNNTNNNPGNNNPGNNDPGNNNPNNAGTNNAPGGVGAACTLATDCTAGLECGCPPSLGMCEQAICFMPEAPSSNAGAEDDSCAAAGAGRPVASGLHVLIAALGLIGAAGLVLLRRR